jgi:hypothetical protein
MGFSCLQWKVPHSSVAAVPLEELTSNGNPLIHCLLFLHRSFAFLSSR